MIRNNSLGVGVSAAINNLMWRDNRLHETLGVTQTKSQWSPWMAQCYVNSQAQPNGDHEAHRIPCPRPANESNRVYLGFFNTCNQAVAVARRRFPLWRINGCYWCSHPCHTS